ncbi:hypothetical protein CKQ69_31365 [Bacillus toyonensis]|nr:hypothetical protein CKQ69_31365 [Bacillus toyonensis]
MCRVIDIVDQDVEIIIHGVEEQQSMLLIAAVKHMTVAILLLVMITLAAIEKFAVVQWLTVV